MNNLDYEIVKLSLNKLFKDRYFSFCSVDRLADLLGVNLSMNEHYYRLKALHCVNYADMPESVLSQLPPMVLDALELKDLDAPVIASSLFVTRY